MRLSQMEKLAEFAGMVTKMTPAEKAELTLIMKEMIAVPGKPPADAMERMIRARDADKTGGAV